MAWLKDVYETAFRFTMAGTGDWYRRLEPCCYEVGMLA